MVNPVTIDYDNFTIINYAFFQPNEDGTVSPFDPWADKNILLGQVAHNAPAGYGSGRGFGDPAWHIPGTSLVDKAHEKGVKVLVSIGGWTMSGLFPSIAASPAKRQRFAQSCRDIVKTYQVDGIDIDWEYPGYAAQNGSSDDKENFTLLLREIRHALTLQQQVENRYLWLTAAFGVAPTRIREIEWEQVAGLLDFINLMTYDYYGRDFHQTNHNSPLYPPAKGIFGYNAHSTVQFLVRDFQVPAEKLCIGVPFYGRSTKTKGSPGLHVASKQRTDSATFSEDGGTPTFYNILAQQDRFFYHWDSLAQVPFLQGKDLNTFVSFEDERSVAQKARYIAEHRLAGAVVWDITGDCVESKHAAGLIESTPLANALKLALCEIPPGEDVVPALRPAWPLELLPMKISPVFLKTFPPRAASPTITNTAINNNQKRRKKRTQAKSSPRYFDDDY